MTGQLLQVSGLATHFFTRAGVAPEPRTPIRSTGVPNSTAS